MVEEEIDLTVTPWLHLVSAFLAMEPPDVLISMSRICGGGSITERVQRFIWNHCICKTDGKGYAPYLSSFLKKLIVEVEFTGADVFDELYEQFAFYMSSFKSDDLAKGDSRVLKQLSFLFPDAPTCPSPRKLVIPLQSSLNMFEGDTGCSIWPSSLFLSEFILSYPEIFSMKSCFEIGSGVGLVGICLAHVKASKVVLSDGDLLSLANLRLNLELNQLRSRIGTLERITQDPNTVHCIHLPWESAPESELEVIMPDIVLGADVIYDPLCIPDLVRVLVALLNRKKSQPPDLRDRCQGSTLKGETSLMLVKSSDHSPEFDSCQGKAINTGTLNLKYECLATMAQPVAYIASVVRNIDTFNYFLTLADKANLTVLDKTQKIKLFDLLPYMLSNRRSNVRLLAISYL